MTLRSDLIGSGSEFSDAPRGSRYTVSKLLQLMITESDNTATNMLIRLVGRRAINDEMTELGLTQTSLHDHIFTPTVRSGTRSARAVPIWSG